jgi:competence protein ComEC
MSAPFLWLYVCFAAGILCGSHLQIPVWVIFASAVPAILSLFARNFRLAIACQIVFVFLIAQNAVISSEDRYENELRNWVRGHEQQTVRIGGNVERTPEIGNEFYVLRLGLTSLNDKPLNGTIRLTISGKPLHYPLAGDRIETYARLRLPNSFRTEGCFNYSRYLQKEGIHALGSVKHFTLLRTLDHHDSFLSTFSRLRMRLILTMMKNFHGGESGILRALWLDDRSAITTDQERSLINAGIFHVIAISGFHVAVLLVLSLFILKRLIPYRIALIILCGLLSFYFLLLEGRSSITRSFLIFLIFSFASFRYERIRWANALTLAALVQIILNPFELFDSGYHLTYLSTAAILFIAVPISTRIHFSSRLCQIPFNLLLISLCVQFVLIPYQAIVFHKIPWISPISNLVAVPLSSILIAAGIITLPFSVVPKFLNVFVTFSCSFLLKTSSLFNQFVPVIPSGFAIWTAWLFYFCLISVMFLRKWRWRAIILSICFVILVHVLFGLPIRKKHDPFFRAHFLDVGQGDAILLEYPDGTFDLLDGGGFWNPEALDIGEAVLLPYLSWAGVQKIHRVFLSHAHADHMNGFLSLFTYFQVEEFYVTRKPYGEASFRHLLRKMPLAPRSVCRGAHWTQAGVTLRVLAPEDAKKTLKVANDDSLVLLLEYGRNKLLLTGDAEQSTEINLNRNSVSADFLKVPHHGSNTSSTEDFIGSVRPRIGFISVGKNNWFGHPDPEVLERYRRHHVLLYRTDRVGTTRLTLEAESYRIDTFSTGKLAIP